MLLGVAAALLVQVVVAVAAGSLVALLPERLLAATLAVIFLVSAVLLLRGGDDDDAAPEARPATPWRVVAVCFGVTLLSELGDPTQIIVATLTARYDDSPPSGSAVSSRCGSCPRSPCSAATACGGWCHSAG